MSLAGSLREIYETDAFPGGTICVVEAASVDEARVAYANLPMLKAGLLNAEYIPLQPFSRWMTLMDSDVAASLASPG